jgi:hypothetical protein
VSSMHFTVAASRWVQTVQIHLRSCSWSEFYGWVLARFGRDHHELLIHQLFHIRQTSSMSEYIDRFSSLVDRLIAYGSHIEPLYFTMRFIDGLQDDIKSDVLVQCPSSWDSACVLAQLQEEVLEYGRGHQPGDLIFSR